MAPLALAAAGLWSQPAKAQSPEVKARIEAAFAPIIERRKKLLTCTLTVPEVVVEIARFINTDREHALAEMERAGFDPAFIDEMRSRTDPDRLIDWQAPVGSLTTYCIGAVDLLHSAISDPRFHDAVLDALAE